jgi:hypothetical protein
MSTKLSRWLPQCGQLFAATGPAVSVTVSSDGSTVGITTAVLAGSSARAFAMRSCRPRLLGRP